MAILALSAYNKNQYRKYPLKQGSSQRSLEGTVVSDDLIVSCSLTATYNHHRIYIKQLHRQNAVLRVAIASVFTDELLGVFAGTIAENFTTLQLTAYVPFLSGFLTIGSLDTVNTINAVLSFEAAATELEESTIFCYTPPAVTSIRDKRGNFLRGNVAFGTLTNVSVTTDNAAHTSNLTALTPDSVSNPKDKSSFLGNCASPVIKNINNVQPYPAGVGAAENDGNIYLVGVYPINFYGVPSSSPGEAALGSIGVATEGVTLDSLCTQKHKLLPPVDVSGFTYASNDLDYLNAYYSKPASEGNTNTSTNYPYPQPERRASNFNSTVRPEYYYWPQFVKPEYYAYWSLTLPSMPIIISVTSSLGSVTVSLSPPINTAGETLLRYDYSVNDGDYLPTIGIIDTIVIQNLNVGERYSINVRAVNTLQAYGQATPNIYITVS